MTGAREGNSIRGISSVRNAALWAYVAALIVFIFAPIMFSVVFSFNSARFPTIPLESFTLHWYETILSDPDVWEAARNSIIVSLSTAVLATFLGFCTAYSDYRFNFRFKGPYLALVLLPPTIPLIIMALAMLAWFSKIGASGQLWSIIIAHTVLTAPFAMAVIRLRLNQMDSSLESAAWNLGASEWRTMREVIVPFCKPAIVSAACLTAAISFDEFAVAWFVSGLNKTVPVVILEIVTGNIDPQVNAIGTFVFFTSMTLVVLAQVFFISRLNKKAHPQ
ncbi:MAG: ABC transporter permease [Pseudomonadota bacterium]